MQVLAYVSTPLGDIAVAHGSHTPVLDDLLDQLEGAKSPKEWALFVLNNVAHQRSRAAT